MSEKIIENEGLEEAENGGLDTFDKSNNDSNTGYENVSADDRIEVEVVSRKPHEQSGNLYFGVNQYSVELEQGVAVKLPKVVVNFIKSLRHPIPQLNADTGFHEMKYVRSYSVEVV
jgi:hypothetical protein